MSATKEKMSITISKPLAHLIEMGAKAYHIPKSQLIEKAIRIWHEYQLQQDAKKVAAMEFDDLPTPDEWLAIAPKWEWKE